MIAQQKVLSPVALTIAGLDPTGRAGVIADVRTFASFGCVPSAAITSLTFQNSRGVSGARHQTAETVRAQVLAVQAEAPVAAVKTGMLPTRETVTEVARLVREKNLPPPVVDPVLRSTSGYQLMESDAIEALLNELTPRARLITPNIPEAEALTGMKIAGEDEMWEAVRKLRETGARAVLVKGGHGYRTASRSERVRREALDLLDDDGSVTVFRGEWIDAPNVRGTGCMLSAAIAASLAHGKTLEESVRAAKQFVAGAIHSSLITHH